MNWAPEATAALASASPALTLLYLFQLKEWRWNRLAEHMRMSGWAKQLYGMLRPGIAGVWLIVFLLTYSDGLDAPAWGLLLSLALLSIVQLGMRRQPMPQWTQKAMAIGVADFVLTMGILMFANTLDVYRLPLMAIVPFIQPLTVALSWLLFIPVDQFLKKRIMQRARAVREANKDVLIIGVTGSVGKTTTKELVAHVLKPLGAISTPAHVNSEIGVAQWLARTLSKTDKPKMLVVEMGAYQKGEIALICSFVKPDIGLVTRNGEEHLGLFGSRDAIVDSNAELLESLPLNGHAFINADSEQSDALISRTTSQLTKVGTGGSVDVKAVDIEETGTGIRFKALDTVFTLPIHGTHNVTNALLAIAVGRHLGQTPAQIADSLKAASTAEHTFRVLHSGAITLLDDTYNSSPQSFAAALHWAKKQAEAKKILVTSGIIELGTAEAGIHRELAKEAASIFSQCFLVGEVFLPYFQEAFGAKVSVLQKTPQKIDAPALIVCVGRMPQSTIQKLLA